MGKALGLFACTTVAAVALWLTNAGQPQQTVEAVDFDPSRAGAAQKPPSARDLLARGKKLFLEGRYAEAAAALESAEKAPGGLTLAEGRDLKEFLDRAREEKDNPFRTSPAVGRTGEDPAVRARVTDMVRRAEQAWRRGETVSAQRLAVSASALAESYRIEFKPGELSPNDLLAKMNGAATASAAPAQPAPAPQAPAEWTAPADGSPKAQASALVAEARGLVDAGQYDAARRAAVEAKTFGASWDLGEDTPDLILAEIERKTGFATFTPAAAAASPAAPAADKSKALALVDEARRELAAGRLASAKEKALAASRMGVTFESMDEDPSVVLDDIRLLEQRGASLNAATPPTTPAAPAAGGADRTQALELLKQAREQIQAGQVDAARGLVVQAQALSVQYDIFDDTPDLVAAEIVRLEGASSPTPASETSFDFGPPPAQESAAAPAAPAPWETAAAPAEEPSDPFGGAAMPRPADFESAPVSPAGPSALEWYQRGLAHLDKGEEDQAYQAFLAAYQSGQKLDPIQASDLHHKLAELNPRRRNTSGVQLTAAQSPADDDPFAAPAADGGDLRITPRPATDPTRAGATSAPLAVAAQQQSLQYDRVRSDAMNAIFRAEKLREENPQQAIEVIDRAIAGVGGANLPRDTVAPLMTQLNRSRESIESTMKTRQPLIDLERRNSQVKADIERNTLNQIRIEQELANLVEKFNELFNQKRYAEAEVIAKQANELSPENPVTEVMLLKARFARNEQRYADIKERKDQSIVDEFTRVEEAMILPGKDFEFGKDWDEINKRRKDRYRSDNKGRTDEEQRIEKSLSRTISLHFKDASLEDVVQHIATTADINVVLDRPGLEEESVTTDTRVSLDVNGIQLRNALTLILKPLNLAYRIESEVLQITSRTRQQGELEVRTYPVADLIVPIPNFVPSGDTALRSSGEQSNGWGGAGSFPQYSVGPGGLQRAAGMGGAQFQVADPPLGAPGAPQWNAPGLQANYGNGQRVASADFDTLSDLITATVEPGSWAEMGGNGTLRHFDTTLSLVVRQTQAVHEEIADLLEQLRRLQDLQVTVEVRFVTVTDRFFEQVGIDFDFDVQDNVGPDTLGFPPFGLPGGNVPGQAATGGQQQGQQGQNQGGGFQPISGQGNAQAGGTFQNFLTPQAVQTPDLDDYQKTGTVVGLQSPGQFTPDLDVGFRQGSFDLGAPDFGNFNPDAGIQVGMAILTDIEAFFFIRAAQGDERSNIMFAPKVTLFNGQSATVQSTVQRPFVTSLIPTVGFFSVGFTPQITVLSEGVVLQVTAVISADRRFVRLTIVPSFTNITDVFTFSFVSGGGGVVGNTQAGAQVGQGQVGAGGGVAGVLGVGGIGGGNMARNALMLALPSQQTTQTGTQQQGQQQQGQQQQGGAGGNVTIQQPVFEVVNVTTTVSVPDGGTVLLGGVKRLREGRNMAGVPILANIPYVSRLFRNTGVGRDTESLMLMVTPRIIIQEEEEELLLGTPPL